MENVEYKIFNPGGNKTGLVYNKNYSKEEKIKINNDILEKYKDVEQVGFIEKDKYQLEMAGGEFCVNATRCAVYEYLNGKKGKIDIQVSAQKEKISGEILDGKVSATLELNKVIDEIYEVIDGNYFIRLDGIDLIVFTSKNSQRYVDFLKRDEEKAKSILKEKMKEFNSKQEAEGIILLEEQNQKFKINPIIWVKSINTIYYETACGSGSLATAIYNYLKNKKEISSILQPSGFYIDVKLDIKNDIVQSAKVSGIVEEN